MGMTPDVALAVQRQWDDSHADGSSDGLPMSHVHGYVRVRFPRLVGILALLHLPFGWLIESGDLPHNAECTVTTAYLRGEDS